MSLTRAAKDYNHHDLRLNIKTLHLCNNIIISYFFIGISGIVQMHSDDTHLHRLYFQSISSMFPNSITIVYYFSVPLSFALSPLLLLLFSCYLTLHLYHWPIIKCRFCLCKQLMRRKLHNTGCVWSWNARSNDEITSVRIPSLWNEVQTEWIRTNA